MNTVDTARAGKMFGRLRARLPKGEFGRNVLVMFGGTTLAQIISILSAPILTRLYSPAAFGMYALFLAITTMMINIASAKYEMAIILPEKDEDGIGLLALSCLLALGLSLLLMVVVVGFGGQIAKLLGNPAIAPWLYFVPIMVFLGGTYNALNYWNNRRKQYKRLAANRVLRTASGSAANLGMGLKNVEGGLILGAIAGQAITTFMFSWRVWREDKALLLTTTWRSTRQNAIRYKNFPKFLVPSGLVESAASQLPAILISSFFGIATLGFFSLALRMVGLPMGLIAESIRDVFRQKASEDYAKHGNCTTIFNQTFRRLLILSVLPFGAIIFFGPLLFQFVFGPQWRVAGEFSQIMAVTFFLRFVSSPLSSMFYIAEKQKWDLVIQSTLFVIIVVSLVGLSRLGAGAKMAVAAYSAIYSVKYLLELYLSYRFSQGHAGPGFEQASQ